MNEIVSSLLLLLAIAALLESGTHAIRTCERVQGTVKSASLSSSLNVYFTPDDGQRQSIHKHKGTVQKQGVSERVLTCQDPESQVRSRR